MTRLLENEGQAVRKTQPEVQDAIARLMFDMVDGEPAEITPEHLDAILEGEAQADRGEFATDEQVAEAFRRFAR